MKEYCSRNDYFLARIYTDEAKTGTNDNRKGFLDMIDDSSKGTFTICIVHKLDRFTRSKYDSAIYKKQLKDNNVKVISVLENLDDSPESIILESVLEGMAEYYSKNLAREVMKGIKETALQYKHNGGIAPTGYDVAPDKTYVINDKEAEIVKTIFKMYIADNGYGIIAQDLNEAGRCTKLGRLFTKSSIRDILLNEKYTGTYIFNKRLSKKDNHKYKDDSEIIRIEDAMPVIISKEDFLKVKSKMDGKKVGPRMNQKRYYLLTGKIICGECGASYVGAGYVPGRNRAKYPIYSCTNKRSHICSNKNIRQDILEGYVITQLKENVFNIDAIEKITSGIYDKLKEKNISTEKEKTSLIIQEKSIQTKIDMAFDMAFEKQISKTLLAKKTNELEIELNNILQNQSELANKDYSWLDEKKIKKFLLASMENLEDEDSEVKRRVIETFSHKIIIYVDRIDVIFKVEPSDSNKNTDSDKVGGGEA
ncbi:recombinase family protein [Clostridium estertheticum]|uniref:recombinase family protein n=1 Tax=Clostridium estertheticum TaxID=238834 RepID=UPI001CF29E84|nr:recombinase family protein [Clostridium estertheticum]MCB2354710.1 recombinase family protein [Clostridium estertheticum]WAG43574.1 recombinase family protein [Clostridium estertheticum]